MNERYERDLRRGLEFQDRAMCEFYKVGIPIMYYCSVGNQVHRGENLNGIEVKYDGRFRETGNLYIETKERSGPDSQWHDAGITRKDNSWAYAIGDYDTIYAFAIPHLRRLWAAEDRYRRVKTDTSEGFLLPVRDAEAYCFLKLPREEVCHSD